VRFGEQRVPATLIASVNYAAWIVVSLLIAWIVMRG
jgi:fumarate reductase subunit C